ncbi:hypothetical protein B0O80DRAFT_499047 [Mortierella sp. GBAus27b]|nr:hypothetical protein B0O80DRAFT_499047 [Mortierella sp. GBAus27b]
MNGLQEPWNQKVRQSLVEKADSLYEGVKELFSRSPRSGSSGEGTEKAPASEELDLDAWIHRPVPNPESESSEDDGYFTERDGSYGSYGWGGEGSPAGTEKAPASEELDLDAWIHRPVPNPESESSEDDGYFTERDGSYGSYGWGGEGSPAGRSKKKIKKGGDQGDSKEGSDARSKQKAERRERQKHDLYYIGEMPEDATISASDDEKAEGSKKATGVNRYPSSSSASNGLLDQELSALHSVDLSIPVGEDQHLPRAKPYMKPEVLRFASFAGFVDFSNGDSTELRVAFMEPLFRDVIAVIAVIEHIKNRPMTKSSVDVIDPKKRFQYIPEALRDVTIHLKVLTHGNTIERAPTIDRRQGDRPIDLHNHPTFPIFVFVEIQHIPVTAIANNTPSMHQDRPAASKPGRILDSNRADGETIVVNITAQGNVTNSFGTVKDHGELQETAKVVEAGDNIVMDGVIDVHETLLVIEGVDGFKYPTIVFDSTFLHVSEDQIVTSMSHLQELNRTKNKDDSPD